MSISAQTTPPQSIVSLSSVVCMRIFRDLSQRTTPTTIRDIADRLGESLPITAESITLMRAHQLVVEDEHGISANSLAVGEFFSTLGGICR